jgi:hypothetical protein
MKAIAAGPLVLTCVAISSPLHHTALQQVHCRGTSRNESAGIVSLVLQAEHLKRHCAYVINANYHSAFHGHVLPQIFTSPLILRTNRNRRWRQPYPVKVKLMGLDFVLAHQQHHYLATEAEKLDYFVGKLGLNHSYLPQRIYKSWHSRNITTRYFVDKFPLFLSGASSAPQPVIRFCYVDGSLGKPSGFDTYLLQYEDLFSRLDGFGIIYMAADERMFPKAGRIFGRMCGKGAEALSIPRDREIERLRAHFRARALFERRETSSFGKAGLDRLREELAEFGGPEYEALYCQWRECGDCILGRSAHCPEKRSGGFATYRVDHDYELFGELSRKIPA